MVLRCCQAVVCICSLACSAIGQEAWKRYAIDDELRGADGVKLADANGDGLLDIVTGWEESGRTRAYFHPGRAKATSQWPFVDLGKTPSTEDAAWVDLDGDGQLDVVSSCEGKEQSLHLIFAPSQRNDLMRADAWRHEVLDCSKNVTRWMFAISLDEKNSASAPIVLASKDPNGQIALLRRSGSGPKDWRIQKLAKASWIMSVFAFDMDGDGDNDILYDDRKSSKSGVYWLENPGEDTLDWTQHRIGPIGGQVMFMDVAIKQGAVHIHVAEKPNTVLHYHSKQIDAKTGDWEVESFPVEPFPKFGNAKGVAVGDLDGDGQDEIVYSCESANPPKHGVIYLKKSEDKWLWNDVSGPDGIKFDLIELVDIDRDGDLDILTCEERHQGRGLGVVWYANPAR